MYGSFFVIPATYQTPAPAKACSGFPLQKAADYTYKISEKDLEMEQEAFKAGEGVSACTHAFWLHLPSFIISMHKFNDAYQVYSINYCSNKQYTLYSYFYLLEERACGQLQCVCKVYWLGVKGAGL